MSNRNSLKRLLGIGAFVCCSVVLLGVTAHSARSEQLPTVSELGTIVTDPLGFVREQPVPPAVPAASAELDPAAEPDGSDAAGAERGGHHPDLRRYGGHGRGDRRHGDL